VYDKDLAPPVAGTVAITDTDWYRFLSARPEITEVNFWTPSARRGFRAPAFSPFLFKLKAPHSAICGFAWFAQYSVLPDWLAWETFGLGNGCASFDAMRDRIGRIRQRIGYDEATGSDDTGCIQLVSPVFFPDEAWIPQPADWKVRTQSSAKYDLTRGEGRRVWEACLAVAAQLPQPVAASGRSIVVGPSAPRYGSPVLMQPRLGQNTFRIAVLDAYGRACSVTNEHSLPALEAAHIQSYANEGPHDVRNGVLLRADLHRLFDKGYVTITTDLRLEVSPRLKRDFRNGRTYYPLHGATVRVPTGGALKPAREFLEWHQANVYRG
jgi:putative restriction endonuclease